MTPIRILSDLHLAHPGCRIESIDDLRPLFEGVGERIIFNGDTIEQRHAEFVEIGSSWLEKLKSLGVEYGLELTFIRGNHDPFISDLDYVALGKRDQILVTHGDVLYPNISPWSPRVERMHDEWERLWDQLEPEVAKDLEVRCDYTDQARRLGFTYHDDFKRGRFALLRTLIRLGWPPRRPYKILETWLTAHRVAGDFAETYRPETGTLIFGHTHRAGDWKVGGRRVINTGGYISAAGARYIDFDPATDALSVCPTDL
jgi:predicted phosphodiesterase